MLRIESNIKGVLAQVERLQARIPRAMEAALQPERWRVPAEMTARRVLNALADPTERPLIEPFVQTVTAEWISNGLEFKMHQPNLPGAGGLDLRGLVGAAQLAGPLHQVIGLADLPLFLNAFLGSRDLAREVIRDWVATEKDLDARDIKEDGTPMTVDEITDRLMSILFDPVGARAAAAESLLASEAERGPHAGGGLRLIDFFAVHPLSAGLGGGNLAALTDRWLRAVLAAWRELVTLYYPARVQQLLRAGKDELI